MDYDKGPQLTAGRLKEYLAGIPDNTNIRIGIGDENAPAHYDFPAENPTISIVG